MIWGADRLDEILLFAADVLVVIGRQTAVSASARAVDRRMTNDQVVAATARARAALAAGRIVAADLAGSAILGPIARERLAGALEHVAAERLAGADAADVAAHRATFAVDAAGGRVDLHGGVDRRRWCIERGAWCVRTGAGIHRRARCRSWLERAARHHDDAYTPHASTIQHRSMRRKVRAARSRTLGWRCVKAENRFRLTGRVGRSTRPFGAAVIAHASTRGARAGLPRHRGRGPRG